MTASIPVVNVAANATFQTLFDVVNQTVNVLNTQAVVPSLTSTLSVSTGNVHIYGTVGADHLYANLELRGGNNSVANTLLVSSNVSVGNSTVNLIITSTSITLGSTVANTSTLSVSNVATSNLTIGNVTANTTVLKVGNTTVNTSALVTNTATVGNIALTGTAVVVGNSTVNTTAGQGTLAATTSVAVGTVVMNTSGVTTGNVIVGTSTVTVGNSTSNVVVNSSAIAINGTVIGGAGTITANSITVGNTTVNTTQINVGLTTLSNTQLSIGGGLAVVNATQITVGNSTVNSVRTATGLTIGTTVVNSSAVSVGGANVVTTATRTAVALSNTLVGVEGRLNIVPGTGIIITVTDDPTNGQINFNINANANAIAGNVTASSITFTPNTGANLTSTNVQDAVVEASNKSIRTGTALLLTGGTLTGGLTIAPAGSAGSLVVAGPGNAGVAIGRTDGTASNPMLDFHSGATASSYDARIYASGGTGANSTANLNYLGLNHVFNVRPVFNGATPYDTNNLTIANYAPLAAPAFTGAATFATRPTFNGQTPYDTGNLTIANYAPLASPAFTGTATFAARPTFNGATPYDSSNFNPSNYATTASLASYAALAGATFAGTVNVGANVSISTTQISIGNSTVNSTQTSTAFSIGGAVQNTSGFAIGTAVHTSTGFSIGSSAVGSTTITCGTVTINTTAVSVNGTVLGSGGASANNPVFQANVTINGANNSLRYLNYTSNNVMRWSVGIDGTTEGGSSSGATWTIKRYNDAGTYVDTPFFVDRSNAQATFATRPIFAGYYAWDSANLPQATLAVAQAGTDNTSFMTASMTKAAITQFAPTGSGGFVSGTRVLSGASPTISSSDAGKVIYVVNNAIINLPSIAAVPSTFFVVIKREDKVMQTVQLKCAGTDKYKDNSTSKYVWQEEFTVYSDGANWYTLDRQRGWVACYDFTVNTATPNGTFTLQFPDTEMSEWMVNFRYLTIDTADNLFVQFYKAGTQVSGANYMMYSILRNGTTISAQNQTFTNIPSFTAGTYTQHNSVKLHFLNTLGTAQAEQRCLFESFDTNGAAHSHGSIMDTSTSGSITGMYIDNPVAGTMTGVAGTLKAFRH